MQQLSPNQKALKKDMSKSKSTDFLDLKGVQAPANGSKESLTKENEDAQNSSSGEEEETDSDYEEFQRKQGKRAFTPEDQRNVSQMGQENEDAGTNMRAEKNIVAKVANLDTRSKYYKQTVLEIMNRIVSTMTSWELFSDNQIQDANTALKMLQQTLIYNPED